MPGREWVTTALDVLGLLLVAAGLAGVVAVWTGYGPALGVAGVVVLGGSWWAARPPRRRKGGL